MRAHDVYEACDLPGLAAAAETFPPLPRFGLTVRLRRQAYDEHGNKLPFAIFPGDRVVTHLDILANAGDNHA